MNKHFSLLLLALCLCGSLCAQDDFQRYVREQEEAFRAYADREEQSFKEYSDSINRDFGRYLAEVWADCPLTKVEPPIKKPVPPEVFDPEKKRPEPSKIPLRGTVELPAPVLPQPQPDNRQEKIPVPAAPDKDGLEASFFGTPVVLPRLEARFPRLSGADENHVAAYWNALSALPYTEWSMRIRHLSTALKLNDWGVYLLTNEIFTAYCPRGTENEQTVFAVFTLNQLGYKAKIGRAGGDLLPLIAFDCDVYNTTYFTNSSEGNIRYSVINLKHRDLASVKCCSMNYAGAKRQVRASFSTLPQLASDVCKKVLNDGRRDYPFSYNKNLVDFYATLPCVSFAIYAQAAVDDVFWQSAQQQLKPLLQGLSEENAVNFLLHFVQHAFQYKTDDAQFGYEKWFFAEETIASSYSDCEDRSILFAQLVRRLLRLPVVLVYYPGRHLATAVRFSNPATSGDYLQVNGQKFLLCDPTYIGATLGMEMPQLKGVSVEVIKLNE